MKGKPKPTAARSKRAMNPLVTLRSTRIQSRKKVASKQACRGLVSIED